MPLQNDRDPWDLPALLKSTGTPFTVAHYLPGGIIFHQGEPSDSVMYIARGRLLLAVTERGGKQAICGLLGTGAFLGEEALGGNTVRRHAAIAMTATRVFVIAKAHMVRLLHQQPTVAEHFIAHAIARKTRLEADLADQLLHSAEQRVARTLLALATLDGRCPPQGVLPRVSQELIAQMVGTTRPRVNAFMRKFRKLGLIKDDDGVLHFYPSRLRIVLDGHRELAGRIAS